MASLSLNDYIVGENVSSIKKFYPSSRTIIDYDAGEDVTGWTFSSQYQILVVDEVSFDRAGDPNFTDAIILGSFPVVDVTGGDAPNVVDAANGLVEFIIPADMYDGPLDPNTRNVAVIAFVSFTIENADGAVGTTRYGRLLTYEPGVPLGDPTTHTGYVVF